ncbi:hypothetical protein E2C01_027616 [Portunus trituberculatus]|uniref:Uncharacterized protein n=1 Tax=Portunus trituberculatus TaxID=210409 RepID=A0A5B7EMF9_PORTR|nr:hypothetical protein [Portunus trituberculatus]
MLVTRQRSSSTIPIPPIYLDGMTFPLRSGATIIGVKIDSNQPRQENSHQSRGEVELRQTCFSSH